MKKNPIFLAMLVVMLASSLVFIGCPDGDENKKKFVAVTDITGVPTTATVGVAFTLAGTVEPKNATNKTITWYDTNLKLSILADQPAPNVIATWKLRATIKDGTAKGKDFTKDFDLVVGPGAAPSDWATKANTRNGATELKAGQWHKEIKNSSGYSDDIEDWYSFTVVKGTTYWIWWDDDMAYADSDKAADITVSGYDANGGVIFSPRDTAWEAPKGPVYFTAVESGTVYLYAEDWWDQDTNIGIGIDKSYAICYHTLATKPGGWPLD